MPGDWSDLDCDDLKAPLRPPEVPAPDEVAPLCNLCGLTSVLGHEDSPAAGPHGLIDCTVYGGYESTPGNGYGALDDCTKYTFSLCEFCLDWLFQQFVKPVAISGYAGEGAEQWKPAASRVAEDDWREMKTEFRTEHERRAAARRSRS
jgi:hypothetical protein